MSDRKHADLPAPDETAQTAPELPSELPVLPLRHSVVFPMTLAPLAVTRPVSIEAVNRALAGDRMVLLLMQEGESDDPAPADLRRIGTVGIIRQMAKAPSGGGLHVLVEGVARARGEISRQEMSLTARLTPMPEEQEQSIEVDAYVRALREQIDRALNLSSGLSQELRPIVMSIDEPMRLAYLVGSLIDMKVEDKQKLLEENRLLVKLQAVSGALAREISLLEL